MATDFSKKMCQQLLLYEDYIASCTSVPFQKDKIIVERDRLLDLIVDLRMFHCADRQLVKGGLVVGGKEIEAEDQLEMQSTIEAKQAEIAAGFTQFTDSGSVDEQRGQPIEAVRQAAVDHVLAESEQMFQFAREQALAESEQILNNAQMQADAMLQQAKHEETQARVRAEHLLQAAKEEMTRIQQANSQANAKAEQIIADAKVRAEKLVTTARESRQNELDLTQQRAQAEREKIIEEAKAGAAVILNEANVQADLILTKAKADITQRNLVYEAQMTTAIEEVGAKAKAELNAKNQEARLLLEDTLEKAEEYLQLITAIYDQQIGVVARDRLEILEIISKLEQC